MKTGSKSDAKTYQPGGSRGTGHPAVRRGWNVRGSGESASLLCSEMMQLHHPADAGVCETHIMNIPSETERVDALCVGMV